MNVLTSKSGLSLAEAFGSAQLFDDAGALAVPAAASRPGVRRPRAIVALARRILHVRSVATGRFRRAPEAATAAAVAASSSCRGPSPSCASGARLRVELDLVLPRPLEVVGGALELGDALAHLAPYLRQLARPEQTSATTAITSSSVVPRNSKKSRTVGMVISFKFQGSKFKVTSTVCSTLNFEP